MDDAGDGLVTLFLCGDVMTGWGVDHVLPHPGDPGLREACADDARAGCYRVGPAVLLGKVLSGRRLPVSAGGDLRWSKASWIQ